ncbi:MAG: hypothetical protein LBH55_03750 [Mycoplasmataceae bacterium]|jgi:enamine deaminase RidA (YjgF/YER057c/UK114 family)|nr:hypothetical protein [Mycoplasmataceae bacterium]
MKIINDENISKAIEHSSTAVLTNGLIFNSGIISSELGNLPNEIRGALQNVTNILRNFRVTVKEIAKLVVYLINIDGVEKFNEIIADVSPDHKPAISFVGATFLPNNAKVMIDVIATINTMDNDKRNDRRDSNKGTGFGNKPNGNGPHRFDGKKFGGDRGGRFNDRRGNGGDRGGRFNDRHGDRGGRFNERRGNGGDRGGFKNRRENDDRNDK